MDIINHCDDETMSRLVYVNRVCAREPCSSSATASWIPIRANSDTGNHCLSVSYAPLDLVIECGSVELSNVHTIRCSLLSAAVMRLFCFTPPMRLVSCLRRQCNSRACTEEVKRMVHALHESMLHRDEFLFYARFSQLCDENDVVRSEIIAIEDIVPACVS
jgi:hypothetical protein